MGLGDFVETFYDNGYDEVEDFANLGEEELREIGFTDEDMNIWNRHYPTNLVKPTHPVIRPIGKQWCNQNKLNVFEISTNGELNLHRTTCEKLKQIDLGCVFHFSTRINLNITHI